MPQRVSNEDTHRDSVEHVLLHVVCRPVHDDKSFMQHGGITVLHLDWRCSFDSGRSKDRALPAPKTSGLLDHIEAAIESTMARAHLAPHPRQHRLT